MELDLSTLFSGCRRPTKPVLLRPNMQVVVWGRVYLYRTPKESPQPVEPPRLLDVPTNTRRPYLGDDEVPAWGKSWKRKPGPKSARPQWEKALGVKISMAAWATIKKREQRGTIVDAQCVVDVLRLRKELTNDR